jgi:antitoxin CcdA
MRMKKQIDDPPRSFRHGDSAGSKRKPGSKRAVNLSIDADILAAAKQQGINLSRALEEELRKRTQEQKIRRFKEESREAVESYNRFIEEHGIWSEKYRSW